MGCAAGGCGLRGLLGLLRKIVHVAPLFVLVQVACVGAAHGVRGWHRYSIAGLQDLRVREHASGRACLSWVCVGVSLFLFKSFLYAGAFCCARMKGKQLVNVPRSREQLFMTYRTSGEAVLWERVVGFRVLHKTAGSSCNRFDGKYISRAFF